MNVSPSLSCPDPFKCPALGEDGSLCICMEGLENGGEGRHYGNHCLGGVVSIGLA